MQIFIDDNFYFLNEKQEVFSISDDFIKEFEGFLVDFLNFLSSNSNYEEIKNKFFLLIDNYERLFSDLYVSSQEKLDEHNLNNKNKENYRILQISKPISKKDLLNIKSKIEDKIKKKNYKIIDSNENLDFLELSQSKFILEEIISDEEEKLKRIKEIYENSIKIIEKDLRNLNFFEKLSSEIKVLNENLEKIKNKIGILTQTQKELEDKLKKENLELKKLEEIRHKLSLDLTKKEPLDLKKISKLEGKLFKISNKIERLEIKIENHNSEIEIYKNKIDLIKKKISLNQKKCHEWWEIFLSLGFVYFTNFGDCKKKGRKYLLKISDLEERILKLKQKINNYKSDEKLLKNKIKIYNNKLKQKEKEISLKVKGDLVQLNILKKDKKELEAKILKFQNDLKKNKFELVKLNENLIDLKQKKGSLNSLDFKNFDRNMNLYFEKINYNIKKNKGYLSLLKKQEILSQKKTILIEIS